MSEAPETIRDWFNRQPFVAQEAARRRAIALAYADILVAEGMTASAAVSGAAVEFGVSARAVWTWRERTRGVLISERVFFLCDRRGA